MLVYDEYGNMRNAQADEVSQKCRRLTADLAKDLFRQGMTVLEGRALIDYMKGNIDLAMFAPLVEASCKQRLERENHA